MTFCEEEEKVNVEVTDSGYKLVISEGSPHDHCNSNAKLSYSSFRLLAFHKRAIYDSHLFIKKFINRKDPIVHFKGVLRTDARLISKTFVRIGLSDSRNFLRTSLYSKVKVLRKDKKFIQNKIIYIKKIVWRVIW